MHPALAIASSSRSRTHLSVENLKAFEEHTRSSSQPDPVWYWMKMTSAMDPPPSAGPSKKKSKYAATENVSSIITSQGPKSLAGLGIFDAEGTVTIPPVSGQSPVHQYFLEPTDIPLVSKHLKRWFSRCEPNEATLVQSICQHVFPLNIHISEESPILLLLEFPGPFKEHNIPEIRKGNLGIQYPIVSLEESESLQTPAQDDLRIRLDFVFAASTMIFDNRTMTLIKLHGLPCLSNNMRSCAVAIIAEVKAKLTLASAAAVKAQWSLAAYLQIKERISIVREAPYANDENICQYGYLICGLNIEVWKMSLRLNIGERRHPDKLNEYFLFPVQCVGNFSTEDSAELENFINLHKQLLSWWTNVYIPNFVMDVTNIISAHGGYSPGWTSTWQEEVEKCQQATSKDVGAENNGAASHQSLDEHCQGFTQAGQRCQKIIKTGRYCHIHRGGRGASHTQKQKRKRADNEG